MEPILGASSLGGDGSAIGPGALVGRCRRLGRVLGGDEPIAPGWDWSAEPPTNHFVVNVVMNLTRQRR
jgi:hypothetical protein